MKLSQKENLQEFFSRKVQEALFEQSLELSPEVEFYIVHLLTRFAQAKNLFEVSEDGQVLYRPLALKLHDAVFSESSENQFLHLKKLGDTALYHAGVFYEGLANQIVDVEYYIQMGGAAYSSLSNLQTVAQRQKPVRELYQEMSERFSELVEILHLSCEAETIRSNHDLLMLLERYAKTGSAKAKRLLKERGICPDTVLEAHKKAGHS